VITADTNDGDYVADKYPITDAQIEEIRPVIEAIMQFEPYSISIMT
jgi:hypothetical protein